jgi:sodium transport system permease protein
MNRHDIWILYRRELRTALRERMIVVNSILMPIFLYPAMLWLMFSGITFVEGLAEGFVSRIVVDEVPARHTEVFDSLAALDNVALLAERSREEAIAQVREGELDAYVEFLSPGAEGRALAGNFQVRIHYDRAVERSRRARDRVEEVIDRYRQRWLRDEARGLDIAPAELEMFSINRRTVSTERERGALLLSEMIPLFLIIMVAFGCFFPAIDSTAGERERHTWETLMTVSASRLSVVTSKYLYVATLGVCAGTLNVLAMFFSIGAVMRPLFQSEGAVDVQFTFPVLAVPVMLAGAVVLGLFFAAAMMILAAFARTFKEGQGMITPVFWLVLLPVILGSSQDRTLTPVLALVPVANVAQMMKDAIKGIYLWPLIVETLVVELWLVVACLMLARFVLRFEDFLLGSYDGSLWRFLRERWGKGREKVGAPDSRPVGLSGAGRE